MRRAAVKTAHNFLLQPVSLPRVLRLDHPLGELTQFLRAQWTAFSRVTRKLDDPVPLREWQTLYLFNDFNRRHVVSLRFRIRLRKPGTFG